MDTPTMTMSERLRRLKLRFGAFLAVEADHKTPYQLILAIVFSSWANVLLPCVPIGIAVHFSNVDAILQFVFNFLAIIPLSGVLTLPFRLLSFELE
jgi:hypothetical protein